ncbi:MAG: hypothetical protein Q8P84_01275 [Deltaproteobacteria bacterium]|nr:hypothetical protein [Deltaproteobacteria bacterium]
METSLLNIDFEPLTEVKAKLSEKVATVVQQNRLLAITLNGKPKAILAPYDTFLEWLANPPSLYEPRRMSLKEWEKESKQRRKVVHAVKGLFDLSKLERKGQKPYKQDALKKFK